MNLEQKEKIKEMRHNSFGYKRIAKALDIPLDTVKSFCRKNKLAGVRGAIAKPMTCRECGQGLVQPEKKKTIKFCSSVCREVWWSKNRHKVNKKTAQLIVCLGCGKEFLAYEHEHRKYCSHSCYISTRFGKRSMMNEKANNECPRSKTAEYRNEKRPARTSQKAVSSPYQTNEVAKLKQNEMSFQLSKIVIDYLHQEELLTKEEHQAMIQWTLEGFEKGCLSNPFYMQNS